MRCSWVRCCARGSKLGNGGESGCSGSAAMLSCFNCRPWNKGSTAPGSSPAVSLSIYRCSCCSCRASRGCESRLASASLETQSPRKVRAVRLGKLSSRCWARPGHGPAGWCNLGCPLSAAAARWEPTAR
ncbi:hypothetical protein HaLaN_17666 [Haematococcus lacustris]|uniref:Uncharacterized protein n=1 Tax=Haematococcus lacustris TaxID=44745 RepID=A0A699ZQ52_HAELA|nr:hypothetical protein HaLaN_17666 [Haematococcus lacustris]